MILSDNLIREHISSFDGFKNYLFMGTLSKEIHNNWNSEKKTSIRCVSKNRIPVWLDNIQGLKILPVHMDNESLNILLEHSFKNFKKFTYILKFVYELLDLFLKKKFVNLALKLGILDMVTWVYSDTTDAYLLYGGDTIAAFHGHLSIVKWFVTDFNYRLNGYLDMYAVLGGNTHILEWLSDNGIKCQKNDLCILASRAGHLDTLKYLVRNNHSFDSSDCRRFAKPNSGVKEWFKKTQFKK